MNRAVSWFCKIFLAPVVKKLLIKEVKGWKNIPKENFILATNHQSHLDEIAAGYVCVPRRFSFIGQTDQYSGFTKLLLYILYFICGVIHLNRKSEESKRKAVEEAIRALKQKDILIIYPEGTRTRTGKIGKGKWGIARIFLETKVPILPVAIKGTFELLPPGGKLKIKRIVKINIGKPLYFKKELEKIKTIQNIDSKEKEKILIEITNNVMGEIASLKSELDLKK
jgi:1-acyl-sn-glycerol-3-phosphate acyltransferase